MDSPFDFEGKGSNHWTDDVARAEALREEFVALCEKYNIKTAFMGVGRVDDPNYASHLLHPLYLSHGETIVDEIEVFNVINHMVKMRHEGDGRIIAEEDDRFQEIKRQQQGVDDFLNDLLGKEKGQDDPDL